MTSESIVPLLEAAVEARADLFDARHEAAFRLFNGFLEGCPDLVVDLYACTIVLYNYADPPERAQAALLAAQEYLLTRLPWVQAIVLKTRNAGTQSARRGVVLYGETIDRRVREHGVWYAIELLMNRDASFYLDTRNLRAWALAHMAGKTVLNTFAYTGSLGVAARASGASRVVHLDRNRAFLNVAKTSYTLNGFPINKADFQVGDFWTQINRLKRAGERFDCAFVDPPFFSVTGKGTVDMINRSHKVINKVRPLINDGGYLVVINNALFLPGADYIQMLETLCANADGCLSVETLIPVPPDFAGYPHTRLGRLPADPAPFNHATKIAVLRVRRKKEVRVMDDKSYTLTVEESPDPENVNVVLEGLREYNRSHVGNDPPPRSLAVFLRDSEGRVAGGLLGETHWGWLHVSILWIKDEFRQQGHGQALMAAAEQEAIRRECRGVHLDTMSFQALSFYEKLGYTVYGELRDFPVGHSRHFLWKALQQNDEE